MGFYEVLRDSYTVREAFMPNYEIEESANYLIFNMFQLPEGHFKSLLYNYGSSEYFGDDFIEKYENLLIKIPNKFRYVNEFCDGDPEKDTYENYLRHHSALLDWVKIRASNIYARSHERYEHLFELISANYDPTTNYDKHSEITVTDEFDDMVTHDHKGLYKTDTTVDGYTDEFKTKDVEQPYTMSTSTNSTESPYELATETTTTEKPYSLENKTEHGKQDTTSKDQTTTYNSDTFRDKANNLTEASAYTDTNTEKLSADKVGIVSSIEKLEDYREQSASTISQLINNKEKDIEVTNKYADRTTSMIAGHDGPSQEDKTTTDSRTDKHTTIEDTRGNIGTMTYQSMATQDLELWNSPEYRSLFDLIVSEVMTSISRGVWL